MQIVALAIFVGICELAGGIGSLFSFPAIPGWYSTLAKPRLNPPNWIFGPVWTALYLLMGIAAFLVSQKGFMLPGVQTALVIFGIQLILNMAWSAIFFGARNPGAAFIEIIILWLEILATIITFYEISPAAAYLLIPYLAWVSFAAYLNFNIWILKQNPSRK